MKKEDFKKYLAGFIDGDGSIFVSESKNSCSLCVSFIQSIQEFVEFVNDNYSNKGRIYSDSRKDRTCYTVRFCGENTREILEDVKDYIIIKKPQCLKALEFLDCKSVEEKLKISKELKVLNKDKTYEKEYNLTPQYLAGLFDAEGCITMKTDFSLRVKLTQKCDIKILEEINKKYTNNTVIDNYACIFWGINSKKLFDDIREYCIIKIPQISIACDLINDIIKRKTTKGFNLDKREGYLSMLKDAKKYENIKIPEIVSGYEDEVKKMKYILEDINTYSYDDLLLSKKLEEIESIKQNVNIEDCVYNTTNWLEINITPKLEVCSTPLQFKIYNYLKSKTSSLPSTNSVGRCIKILVKDSSTGLYIGLICLSSPVYSMGKRDDIFTEKNSQLRQTMDISCCVPLQPFGFNTCGGKLLSMLCFSKEMAEIYKEKYNEELVCLVTTSINGKSIQYSRLKELKYIGDTLGKGTAHLPEEAVKVLKNFNNVYNIATKKSRVDTMTLVDEITNKLKVDSITNHLHKRGIYYGFLYNNFDSEPNTNKLRNIAEITRDWFERYAKKRILSQLSKNTIKSEVMFYTPEYFDVINFKRYKLPGEIKCDEKLEEPQKNPEITRVLFPVKRTSQKRIGKSKLSEAQDEFIKSCFEDYNGAPSTVVKLYFQKFQQNISRQTVSKKWSDLKPDD